MPLRRAASGALAGAGDFIDELIRQRAGDRTALRNDQLERARKADELIASGKLDQKDRNAFITGTYEGPSVQDKMAGILSSIDKAPNMVEAGTPTTIRARTEAAGLPTGGFGVMPNANPAEGESGYSAGGVPQPKRLPLTSPSTLPSTPLGPVQSPELNTLYRARAEKARTVPAAKIGSDLSAEGQPQDIYGRPNPDTGMLDEVQRIAAGGTSKAEGTKQGTIASTSEDIQRPGKVKTAAAVSSAQKRAELQAEMNVLGMLPQQQQAAFQLSDDYEKASTDYFVRELAFRDMAGLAKQASTNPAAGVGLVFKLMKLYDPTSTVREGEQAQARDATNVPGWLLNYYNTLVVGKGALSEPQVNQFMRAAKTVYEGAGKAQADRDKLFSARAQSYHISPSLVVRPPAQDVIDSAAGVGKPNYVDPALVKPLPPGGR